MARLTRHLTGFGVQQLCAVDADGDVAYRGAELLVQSAIRLDPQVLLRDGHLEEANRVHPYMHKSRHTVKKNHQ